MRTRGRNIWRMANAFFTKVDGDDSDFRPPYITSDITADWPFWKPAIGLRPFVSIGEMERRAAMLEPNRFKSSRDREEDALLETKRKAEREAQKAQARALELEAGRKREYDEFIRKFRRELDLRDEAAQRAQKSRIEARNRWLSERNLTLDDMRAELKTAEAELKQFENCPSTDRAVIDRECELARRVMWLRERII